MIYCICKNVHRLRAAQEISFCSVCAINGKGFSSKLRVCCLTRRMSCISCPAGTVVTINMVGVLLKICSMYYYLCPSCTGMKVWAADGSDLCPWLLQGKGADVSGSRGCACREFSSARDKHPHCTVCGSRNICPRGSMTLIDAHSRTVQRVGLCGRHTPPDQLLCMVTCVQDFEKTVKEYCLSKAAQRRAKRRVSFVQQILT